MISRAGRGDARTGGRPARRRGRGTCDELTRRLRPGEANGCEVGRGEANCGDGLCAEAYRKNVPQRQLRTRTAKTYRESKLEKRTATGNAMSGQKLNVLVLPGYQNSGTGHWQTLWEALDPAFVCACEMRLTGTIRRARRVVPHARRRSGRSRLAGGVRRAQPGLSGDRLLGVAICERFTVGEGCGRAAGGGARSVRGTFSAGCQRLCARAAYALAVCEHRCVEQRRFVRRRAVLAKLRERVGQPLDRYRAAWSHQCRQWTRRLGRRAALAGLVGRAAVMASFAPIRPAFGAR